MLEADSGHDPGAVRRVPNSAAHAAWMGTRTRTRSTIVWRRSRRRVWPRYSSLATSRASCFAY